MKRFLAISFIAYFLLLAMGIGVSTHLCGGRVMSSSLFVEAPSCGHEAANTCNRHPNSSKGCCDHEYELIKLEGEYFSTSDVVVEHNIPVVPVVDISQYVIVPHATQHNLSFNLLRPPPDCTSTRLALLQSYRC